MRPEVSEPCDTTWMALTLQGGGRGWLQEVNRQGVSDCIAVVYIVRVVVLFHFSSSVSVNSFYLSPEVLFCFQFSPFYRSKSDFKSQ